MKIKLFISLSCLGLISVTHARVTCFQKNKSINMSHGGVVKKLDGEVICKRGDRLQRKEFFKKGVRLKQQFFDQNEKLKSEQNFNANKKRDGKSIDYYPNGQIKLLEIYKDGKEIGPELAYYESGKLKKKTYFVERKKSTFEYTEEGKLTRLYCQEEVRKFDDKKEQAWCGWAGKASEVKLYDRKGEVYKTVSYHRGKIQKYSQLNKDGVAVKSKSFAKGKINNIEISKYDNGKVKQEKRYNKKGLLDGLQKEFSEEGTLVREANFKNGFMEFEKLFYLNSQLKIETTRKEEGKKILAHKKEYWDNGQKLYEGSFIEDRHSYNFGFGRYYSYRYYKKTGDHREWSDKGVLTSLERYKDGEYEGEQSYFWGSGKLRSKQFFKKGKISRKQKFDEKGKKVEDMEVYPDGSIKLDLMKTPKS